jgi:hypothetical protein
LGDFVSLPRAPHGTRRSTYRPNALDAESLGHRLSTTTTFYSNDFGVYRRPKLRPPLLFFFDFDFALGRWARLFFRSLVRGASTRRSPTRDRIEPLSLARLSLARCFARPVASRNLDVCLRVRTSPSPFRVLIRLRVPRPFRSSLRTDRGSRR